MDQFPNENENYFGIVAKSVVGNKKTHSKDKSGKIAMKKKKLLNLKIQCNKYSENFPKI